MATRTKRRTDVPVVPLVKWEKPAKSLHLHIPHKRRHFRGPGSVPITSAGYIRCRLFWSAPIRDDADLGVVVALGQYERTSYDVEVVVLNVAGVIVSRCDLPDDPDRDWWWHRARFIETAKAGLAVLRERSAPVPEVGQETWTWVALQFEALFDEGLDDDDEEA
jgi:hypothetical protein